MTTSARRHADVVLVDTLTLVPIASHAAGDAPRGVRRSWQARRHARSDSGLASGLVNTPQQVGGALGLAVATLSTSRADTLLASGEAVPSALTSGYRVAFIVATGLLVGRDRARRDGAAAGGRAG